MEATGKQKDGRSREEGKSCLFQKGILKFEIEFFANSKFFLHFRVHGGVVGRVKPGG